jgi:hypothetical protein
MTMCSATLRRLREEQRLQQQQQQENASKAAERGVSAQRLLQAEQNRRRMEQALQELESNEVRQRKQDLAPDKLTAAPLLRKWHKQKIQAKARVAFERDFLPGSAAAGQQGLPSFLTQDDDATQQRQGDKQEQQQVQQSPAHQTATAADRALKLVQELERQRRAEAAAAAAEQQQRQQERERLARAAAAAAAAGSSLLSGDSEVPVDDLITFIPPVSSADSHQLPATPTLASDALTAAAAEHAALAADTGTASEPGGGSTALTDLLGDSQVTSTASFVQDSERDSSLRQSFASSTEGGSAADTASASAHAAAAAAFEQHDAALRGSSVGATASTVPGTSEEGSADSSTPSSPAAAASAGAAAAVFSSRDSLDAIIAAADEVLRQLPADMQAAAAARAAAGAAPALTLEQQAGAGGTASLRSSAEQSLAGSGAQAGLSSRGRPAESSADATAILAELRALQQQLGVQVGKAAAGGGTTVTAAVQPNPCFAVSTTQHCCLPVGHTFCGPKVCRRRMQHDAAAAAAAAAAPAATPLPLQVLDSQSSFSALADLQSFDEAVDRLTAQQLSAHQTQLQAGATAAAGSSGAGASARLRASAAAGAAASAGLSEALDGARQQLQAGRRQQQQEEAQPLIRTQLDVSNAIKHVCFRLRHCLCGSCVLLKCVR